VVEPHSAVRGWAQRRVRRGLRFSVASLLVALGCLFLCTGPALALDLPVRVDTRLSTAEQFGYRPDYELNIPSFDVANHPTIRSRTVSQHITAYSARLIDDAWVRSSLLGAVRAAYPSFAATVHAGGFVSERIEFDDLGRAYTLLDIRLKNGTRRNVLLYSLDGCTTWRLVTLPFGGKRVYFDGRDRGTAALEQYAGYNTSPDPPLLAVWRPVADWPGSFACRNELYVLKPFYEGDRLVLPAPALVTRRFVGLCAAAGGASFAASVPGTSFLVYARVSSSDDAGTPTCVAAFDHASATITQRRLLAYARPRNDHHVTPGIVRDGDGYLHVLTGAHQSAFYHLQSANPLDASAWSAPTQVLHGGFVRGEMEPPGRTCQTYLSLACLPDGRLVIVYRQRRAGVDRAFGGRSYDALCCQVRSTDGTWSAPRRLVFCRNRAGYAQYFQKLTVDRAGRLYLMLSYFNPHDWPKSQRAAHRYHHRMLLISKDGGQGWEFATTLDFIEGIALVAAAG